MDAPRPAPGPPVPGPPVRSRDSLNNVSLQVTDRMHDLTGFQRDLLYVIAGKDEPHGLAIKADLDSYYGAEINHGRLYPNLDVLVEKGLVEKGKLDERTNAYVLTNRGHRELAARREWEERFVADMPDEPAHA